jgi:hypothetical protein
LIKKTFVAFVFLLLIFTGCIAESFWGRPLGKVHSKKIFAEGSEANKGCGWFKKASLPSFPSVDFLVPPLG